MKKDILLSLFTAVLAFLGALGGTYASAYLNERQFNRQFELEQKQQLLAKRVAIIEDCVRARAGMVRAKMIMGFVDVEKLRIVAASKAKGKVKVALENFDTGVHDVTMQQEYFGLMTNYSVCQQMSGLYFGPKTREALATISKVEPWYENPDSQEILAFIKALHDELLQFPASP